MLALWISNCFGVRALRKLERLVNHRKWRPDEAAGKTSVTFSARISVVVQLNFHRLAIGSGLWETVGMNKPSLRITKWMGNIPVEGGCTSSRPPAGQPPG